MSRDYRHDFEFELPLFPHQSIGEASPRNLKIEMDGKPLEGVTDITVRAGANGFTNVVLGFEASTLIKASAVLVAQLNDSPEELRNQLLGGIFDEATVGSMFERWDPDLWDFEGDEKADFVKRVVELLMERVGGEPL